MTEHFAQFTMTDQEFISKLLDIEQPISESPSRFSCVILLLKSARSLSGRNLESGNYEGKDVNVERFQQGSFMPLKFAAVLNYLILLEQLGSIFRPSGVSASFTTNPIENVLTHFSSLSDPSKIKALVSLRNTLAHRFSLATEKAPRYKPPRKFVFNLTRNKDIIDIPAIEWTGDFGDKREETSTIVYIDDLIELIESVHANILEQHKACKLQLALAGGIEELKSRYTVLI
jgi:hypothetical protein